MFASSFDGARIYYEVTGEANGRTLMLSNSLGTALGMWDPQIPAFAEHFRVIRYDARGHGQSEAPEGDYSIDMLGRDALAVLDAAGAEEQVSFVGLSKGGMVGQWLGAHAPEVLDRLVLANTAAHMPPPEMWQERIDTVRARGMEALVDAVVDRWFTPGFLAREPAAVGKVRAMILATPARGYAGACAAIRDMDQREAIGAIETPTLVIAGRQDPATPMDKAEEIAERVRGSRLAALEAAHLSNIEAAPAFTEAVLAFLKA